MKKKKLSIFSICSLLLAAIVAVFFIVLIATESALHRGEITGTFTITVDGEQVQPLEIRYQIWEADVWGEPPPIKSAPRFGDFGFSIADSYRYAFSCKIIFSFENNKIPQIILNYSVPDRWRGAKINITVEVENGITSVKVECNEKHTRGITTYEAAFQPDEMIWVEFGSHE